MGGDFGGQRNADVGGFETLTNTRDIIVCAPKDELAGCQGRNSQLADPSGLRLDPRQVP